jgi:hypothetical protein
MLHNYYWAKSPSPTFSSTTPRELNNYFIDNDGYSVELDCEGCINWGAENIYSGGKIINTELALLPKVTFQYLRQEMDKDLQTKKPVLIYIRRPDNSPHFILAVGKCGEKYVVANPNSDAELYDPLDPQNPMKGIVRYKGP